jgi:hypothetical protein
MSRTCPNHEPDVAHDAGTGVAHDWDRCGPCTRTSVAQAGSFSLSFGVSIHPTQKMTALVLTSESLSVSLESVWSHALAGQQVAIFTARDPAH